MIELEKYKDIFGNEDFNFICSVFPTFTLFMDSTIGENGNISHKQKIDNLIRVKTISNLEYQDYKEKNPTNENARLLYMNYQYWIDSNVNSLNKMDVLSETIASKTARGNKDLLLNQEQIVILFKYMQRINIFDSKQKLNTKMSNAINLLTGWDKKNTANIFSEVNDSSSSSINIHKVCNAIKTLLKEIEKDLS